MQNSARKTIETKSWLEQKLIPLFIGLILTLITLFVWFNLERRENDKLRTHVELANEQIISFIDADLEQRIDALKRLCSRWEVRNGTPEDEFIEDALHYVVDNPGYQAIEWADNKYVVRWIVPYAGNEKVENINLHFEEKRRNALEKAKVKRNLSITEPIDLIQGGRGFLVYLPLYIDSGFDGFIIAVFRTEEWLEHVFRKNESVEMTRKFKVSVAMDEVEIYQQAGWIDGKYKNYTSIKNDIMFEHHFTTTVQPTDKFISESHTWLPEITLFFGLFLSAFSAIAFHIYRRAHQEYVKSNRLAAQLENENKIRELTEKNLERANKRMSLAAYSAGIGIWDYDLKEEYLFWDKMMFSIYGVNEEKFSGDRADIFNCIHPDDRDRVEEEMESAIEGYSDFNTEFKIIQPSKEIRYVHASAIVLRDKDLIPNRITGINHDITQRKVSEEELRDSELRWEFAVDGSDLGLWDWNTQTNEVFYSKQWKKMLGYEEDDINGSLEDWDKRVHPDDKKQCYEDINTHLEGRVPIYLNEHRVLCKDGSYKWILDRGRVIEWDSEDKPLRMIGTHTDITNQKNYEEKLKKVNQRMLLATEAAGIGIWELDLATKELIWDEWMLKLYGLKEKEFPGAYEAWENGIHPDDKEKSVEELNKAVKGEKDFDTQFRVIHPDGAVRTIKANALVIKDKNGAPVKMTGINYDITEQKNAEEMKAQEGKLKTAVQIAQAVAHEFRQPMTTLNLVAQLISMQGANEEFIKKNLDKIPDSIERINKLVDQLLKIEDIKTFRYTENLDVFDIAASAGETEEKESDK